MAKVFVKMSHPITGGSFGHLTVVTRDQDFMLTRLTMKESADLLPDGYGHVLHATVKRHVAEFLKDTRYCFTSDPESGFECEMRVL